MILLSMAVAAAQEPMSVEDIAATRAVVSLHVAPNGTTVAYGVRNPRDPFGDEDGTPYTELHMLMGTDSRPFITGAFSFGSGAWSADSKHFYYLAKREGDDHKVLFRIPVDGGESERICSLEGDISGFSLDPTSSRIALLGQHKAPEFLETQEKKGFTAKIYEETARATQLWMGNAVDCDPSPLSIEGHVDEVRFAPTGDRLLLAVSPTPQIDDLYMQTRLRITDLQGKVLASIDNLGKLGPALWSPDGSRVAWIGVTDRHDPSAGRLRVADATTGAFERLFDDLEGHIRDLSWSTGGLYAAVHLGVQSEVWRVDPVKKSHRLVLGQDGPVVRALGSAGKRIFALADTPSHPSEVFSISNRVALRLTGSNAWLHERKLGRQEPITWTAADGLEIQGLLVYPTDYEEGKRYPLIIYVHGGPEAHDSNGWLQKYSWPVQVAAGQGYFGLIPNYRGSTGRGVAYSKLDQHGYARPEFDDIVDGKNHLVAQGWVDAERVGITGGSYGGYATAWSATALSEHYAAGVMFVGISDQISKFGTTDIPNEMYDVHARAWPWDDWQWFLDRSPIYHAQESNTPLLILHGEEDTRVHPSQSIEMYRYLKLRGQAPVRLVLYPGEGHGNKRAASQYDYSVRLLRWMDHYLKGERGAPPVPHIDYTPKFEKQE